MGVSRAVRHKIMFFFQLLAGWLDGWMARQHNSKNLFLLIS